MDFSFRHIEVFVTVAKYSSISKAAEKLYMSQSAISMALAEFEKRLGTKLFDRVNKKFILNNHGEKLFFKAKNILAELKELEGISKDKDCFGTIAIGATQTIGNYLLPEIIGRFKENCPDVDITLFVHNTEEIMEKLLNFEIDIGFVEGLVNSSKVESLPWMEDELVVFSSPTHHLAQKEKITLADIAKAKWVLREKGSGTRDIFERELYKRIDNIKVYLEVGHTEAIKKIVEANIGIGCLSILTIKREVENNLLYPLKIPFAMKRKLEIVLHKKKYKTNIINHFISFAHSFKKLENL